MEIIVRNERRPPTHTLTIEVPLSLEDPSPDFDVVRETVTVCLAVSRAAFSGHICDDPQLTLQGVSAQQADAAAA